MHWLELFKFEVLLPLVVERLLEDYFCTWIFLKVIDKG